MVVVVVVVWGCFAASETMNSDFDQKIWRDLAPLDDLEPMSV